MIKNKGNILIEALIALVLITIILVSFTSVLTQSKESSLKSVASLKALFLLEETVESVNDIWQHSWDSLTEGEWYPQVNVNSWVLASGAETVDGIFNRSLTIESVSRDGNGNIVTSGTLDPLTYKITANISWQDFKSHQIQAVLFPTRWLNNSSWQETNQADFADGELLDTDITTMPNQVQLAIVNPDPLEYATEGEYTSFEFDPGAEVGFNRITWMGTEPIATNIKFQIATSSDGLSYDFVGPDGTDLTYYEDPGAIPLTKAKNRYFKYKIFLTGDGSDTPAVEEVSLNYCP